MSVALTEDAVRDRRSSNALPESDRWRKDEPLLRICEVEVVDVRRERLSAITDDDVERQGFDINEWVASDFVEFFCEHMNCMPDTQVTRIEWRYLP
jgi:hypothetical protein